MAGRLGLEIDLDAVPTEHNATISAAEKLFSESGTRFLITARHEKAAEIAEILSNVPHAKIGRVVEKPEIELTSGGKKHAVQLDAILEKYKSTLDGV
jgi:phosphoribosylformylglycinamidine synthase